MAPVMNQRLVAGIPTSNPIPSYLQLGVEQTETTLEKKQHS
jgi:hypothetical protein